MEYVELIGWVGNTLLAICGAPQVYTCWKQGHGEGLAAGFLWCWCVGEILAFIYVLCFEVTSWPLIANYSVNTCFILTLIWYKYFPRV